jgi:hypothetical protein
MPLASRRRGAGNAAAACAVFCCKPPPCPPSLANTRGRAKPGNGGYDLMQSPRPPTHLASGGTADAKTASATADTHRLPADLRGPEPAAGEAARLQPVRRRPGLCRAHRSRGCPTPPRRGVRERQRARREPGHGHPAARAGRGEDPPRLVHERPRHRRRRRRREPEDRRRERCHAPGTGGRGDRRAHRGRRSSPAKPGSARRSSPRQCTR